MTNLKLCIVALLALMAPACASMKPIVKTIDDAARFFCAQHYSQLQGVSLEDALESYCRARENWAPWIDPLLAAQAEGTMAALAASAQPSVAPPVVSEQPPTETPPPAKPAQSGAQEPPAVPAPSPAPSASTGPPEPG
jgi:hypothetical protein